MFCNNRVMYKNNFFFVRLFTKYKQKYYSVCYFSNTSKKYDIFKFSMSTKNSFETNFKFIVTFSKLK